MARRRLRLLPAIVGMARSVWLSGLLRRHVFASARPGATYLDHRRFTYLDVMRLVRRLGIKTPSRQRLEFGRIGGFAVARMPDPRENRDLARVRMEMRRQLESGRELEAQRVRTRLARIADQVDL